MTSHYLLAFTLGAGALVGQSRIQVNGLADQGILLHPAGSAAFDQELSTLVAAKSEREVLTRVMPYSAFVTNRSGKHIREIRIRYDFAFYVSGKPIHHASTVRSRTSPTLPNGAARIITPVFSINPGLNRGRLTPGVYREFQQAIDREIIPFERANSTIVLSIDAVVFVDGTLAGPDKLGMLDERAAERRAEEDFKTQVSTKAGSALREYLNSINNAPRSDRPAIGGDVAAFAYSDRLRELAGGFAAALSTNSEADTCQGRTKIPHPVG